MSFRGGMTFFILASFISALAVAQSANAIGGPFAQQMSPILDRIIAMKAKEKYSQQTTSDLETIFKLAKSEAEIHEVSFLQQDISGYLEMETKPSFTARRKQCLMEIKEGNRSGMFNATASKPCMAITNAIYP